MEEQNRNKETAPGEARRPSSVEEAEAAIEAVLFAMGDSVELGRIAKAIGHDTETTRRILNHMMEKYNTKDRGIHIVELENAYQMCTKQEYYDYLVNIAMQPKKAVLTDVMMETLSIIAYKQPVTKQEIAALDSYLKWELELGELLGAFDGPILWVSHELGGSGTPFRILRIIPDAGHAILLLQPEGAAEGSPVLRAECKAAGTYAAGQTLPVSFREEKLLFF